MVAVSDSEDDNNDNNKRWEEAAEITKVNTVRVTHQNKKRNTQPQTQWKEPSNRISKFNYKNYTQPKITKEN